jgi:molybdopterin synthase catalytic subunit
MESEVIFTDGPIVIPESALSSLEIGAMVEFSGIVREHEGESRIAGLFYEAYEPMARREFERIFSELAAIHPIHRVLVIHRLGKVMAGDSSLYVRVEARNRGPALAFCGALIDRMKQDVPIWKTPVGRVR